MFTFQPTLKYSRMIPELLMAVNKRTLFYLTTAGCHFLSARLSY